MKVSLLRCFNRFLLLNAYSASTSNSIIQLFSPFPSPNSYSSLNSILPQTSSSFPQIFVSSSKLLSSSFPFPSLPSIDHFSSYSSKKSRYYVLLSCGSSILVLIFYKILCASTALYIRIPSVVHVCR